MYYKSKNGNRVGSSYSQIIYKCAKVADTWLHSASISIWWINTAKVTSKWLVIQQWKSVGLTAQKMGSQVIVNSANVTVN